MTKIGTMTVMMSTCRPSPKMRPKVQIEPRAAGMSAITERRTLPIVEKKTNTSRAMTSGGMITRNHVSRSRTDANTTGFPEKVSSRPSWVTSMTREAVAVGSSPGVTSSSVLPPSSLTSRSVMGF